MKLETKLFLVTEFYELTLPCLSSLDSNACTLGAVTTCSGTEFHSRTTFTAKLYFHTSTLDGCVLSLSECPLIVVFLDIYKMSQVLSLS